MLKGSDLRITFNPGAYVLLDFHSVNEDKIADDVEPGMEQQTSVYAAIGAMYGGASGDGGARRPIRFTRRVAHTDRPSAMNYCFAYPALLPFGTEGTLTVEIEGGATFTLEDAVLHTASPRPCFPRGNETDTVVQLSAGLTTPTADLPVAPGYPLKWYLTDCEDIDIACGDL